MTPANILIHIFIYSSTWTEVYLLTELHQASQKYRRWHSVDESNRGRKMAAVFSVKRCFTFCQKFFWKWHTGHYTELYSVCEFGNSNKDIGCFRGLNSHLGLC